MDEPLVSVVIPTYNRAHYLAETVSSVLAQTWGELDVIIVDDGSTDGTRALVNRRASDWGRRVRYVHQENRERSAARNHGLSLARGEFVAFLDSDDLWRPDHLRACLAEFERHPDAVAVYGEYGLIDAGGSIIHDLVTRRASTQASLVRDLCLKRLILHPSEVVIKRSLLPGGSTFDVEINGAEDWLMWVRLADQRPFRALGFPTIWMRSHPGGTFGEPARFSRSLMLAAEKVIATGIPQKVGVRASRVRRINQIHCAYAHYLAGRWPEARGYLRAAWGTGAEVIREPDFWRVACRLLIGRSLSRRIRSVRNRAAGGAVKVESVI